MGGRHFHCPWGLWHQALLCPWGLRHLSGWAGRLVPQGPTLVAWDLGFSLKVKW